MQLYRFIKIDLIKLCPAICSMVEMVLDPVQYAECTKVQFDITAAKAFI